MKILYFGRKNCKRSDKLREFLKKKTKNFYHFEVSRNQKNDFNLNNLIRNEFDFIISFRSFFIVPKKLLNKSKLSINFHPGTPKYRGIGCVNYAIYNNENFFGSTAHLINEHIDNGPIINVKKFKIKKSLDLNGVLELTWDNMLEQSIEILDKAFKDEKFIKNSIKNYKGEKWSNKIFKRKDLENFYRISLNSNLNKFNLKIKATNIETFKPYILFHGKKFEYKDEK